MTILPRQTEGSAFCVEASCVMDTGKETDGRSWGSKVPDLVVGMGALVIVMGVTNALFLAPRRLYASRVADRLDESRI
jgi:hypothetical protein